MATGMRALLDTVVQALPQVCLPTHAHTHASFAAYVKDSQELIDNCGMLYGQPGQIGGFYGLPPYRRRPGVN